MADSSSMLRSSGLIPSGRRPLPHRLRLLFVGPSEPPWALLALRLESAGCAQAEFDWESDVAAALARLRKTSFDCLIVLGQAAGSPEPPATAVATPREIRFVEALRGSGSDEPLNGSVCVAPSSEYAVAFGSPPATAMVPGDVEVAPPRAPPSVPPETAIPVMNTRSSV